jgi:hypothetical protein
MLVRLHSFPEIMRVEDYLRLRGTPPGGPLSLPAPLSILIDSASTAVFGTTRIETCLDETDLVKPDGTPLDEDEMWKKIDAYELNFCDENSVPVEHISAPAQIRFMSKLSIDICDDQGIILKSADYFIRQAIAAAKGLKGKLPDMSDVNLELWKKDLERDVERFRAVRRTR